MTEQERESARHVARVMNAAEFVSAYRAVDRDQRKSLHDLHNALELDALLARHESRGGSVTSGAESDHGTPPVTVSSQEPSAAGCSR